MAQNKNNKPNSGLYVAVFFVLVILIVIMFFVKKDNIVSNLKKTNFFERVGVATPEFVEKHPIKQEKSVPDDIEIDLMDDSAAKNNSAAGKSAESAKNDLASGSDVKKNESLGQQTEIAQNPQNLQNEKQPEKTEKIEETKNSSGAETASEKSESVAKNLAAQKTSPAQNVSQSATRTATLYFVSIGADGSVNRQAVKRQLAKSDSPLTDAIKALLAGPVPGEKNAMSLIPSGSKLIGASVKDGVATLNFNENFEFNTYGVEGSIGQLMQIVYTATEFSTVKSVQFLIEGEKKEYLGSEGQWIGTPLARSSF